MNELPEKLLAADEPATVTVYNADGNRRSCWWPITPAISCRARSAIWGLPRRNANGTSRPNDPDAAVRVVFSAFFLMQRSLTFLLCLIDLKAEQKERDDRVVIYLSRPIGARHISPPAVSVSDKITLFVDLMCAFWATPTNHFDV